MPRSHDFAASSDRNARVVDRDCKAISAAPFRNVLCEPCSCPAVRSGSAACTALITVLLPKSSGLSYENCRVRHFRARHAHWTDLTILAFSPTCISRSGPQRTLDRSLEGCDPVVQPRILKAKWGLRTPRPAHRLQGSHELCFEMLNKARMLLRIS